MVHVLSNDGKPRKVIIVGFYCNPEHSKKKESMKELDLLMKNLRQKYPEESVILMADMNQERGATTRILG
jgi:hypothetical protein